MYRIKDRVDNKTMSQLLENIRYEACVSYQRHSLLIETTLADGNNQRRMEMEPVSRHLWDYRIRFNNPFDYSLFVSTYLDKNVISDFRYRKIIPYTRDEETITGMKIISMATDSLKKIIENKVKYKYLYEVFDKYHEMQLETVLSFRILSTSHS